MSQRSAAWSLIFQLVPAVGLVFVFASPVARSAPVQFFYISAALYTVGLGLFAAAKVSLFRQARYVSWGSKQMTTWNRRAYRTGYVLMVCGIVAAFLLSSGVRSECSPTTAAPVGGRSAHERARKGSFAAAAGKPHYVRRTASVVAMRRVIVRHRGEQNQSGGLDFDFADLFKALGPRAVRSDWTCNGLQYCSTDERDVSSLELAASGQRVSGAALFADQFRILQVIDGEFRAFDAGAL